MGCWVFASSSAIALGQEPEEKHHEDPTKVITKLGVGYSDVLTVSGSLALDAVRKVNGNINEDGSEWRVGGSWLFDFGIVNFSFGHSKYDSGGGKDNYSIGTFLPLNALGVDTGKWMIFPSAGLNHNKTEFFREEEIETVDELVLHQNTSNGAYIGCMALRPITQYWTLLMIAGGGIGSNDYSNVFGGIGMSYKVNGQHSLNAYNFGSKDDYGSISKLVVNYTYEFK